MGKELRMSEMKCDEKREDDENELRLELSIGGIYGESKKSKRNERESVEKDDAEEALNVQSKREMQAFRRQEARRKRDEKLKKSVGFVENKEWLQGQVTIGNGENEDVVKIEPPRKKEKIGKLGENGAVAPVTDGFVNKTVMPVCSGGQVVNGIDQEMNVKRCVFRSVECRSFRPYQGNRSLKSVGDEMDGGGRTNGKVNANGSPGCGYSAFSDSQCSSRQGGSTDDSRSNTSHSQLDQPLPSTSAASDPLEQSDQNTGSSKQTRTMPMLTDPSLSDSTPAKPRDGPSPSSTNAPDSKPDTSNQQSSFLARMPCVSTTGNGPNGKTVSGFLYRYTSSEVSIVCVCHGSLFSPAGFVEHAGGVDVVHPLKHINIFPTAFGS